MRRFWEGVNVGLDSGGGCERCSRGAVSVGWPSMASSVADTK